MDINLFHNQQELVINYHITKNCNYSCNYCFANWNCDIGDQELHKHMSSLDALAKEVRTTFPDMDIRINIAGGEPLLIKNIHEVIDVFYSYGFRVGIITNASRLNNHILKQIACKLDVLGISLDSDLYAINQSIGRCENMRPLDLRHLVCMCNNLRELNPDCKIKINTVVTTENCSTSLKQTITAISPDKWKIMQVVPFESKRSGISLKRFEGFLERHSQHKAIIQSETAEQMINSYLMLDPFGRLFYNHKNTYRYSDPILKSGFMNAASSIEFDLNKYAKRYGHAKVS